MPLRALGSANAACVGSSGDPAQVGDAVARMAFRAGSVFAANSAAWSV